MFRPKKVDPTKADLTSGTQTLSSNHLKYSLPSLSNDSIEEENTEGKDKPDGDKYERAEHVVELVDLMLDGEVAGHLEHTKLQNKYGCNELFWVSLVSLPV